MCLCVHGKSRARKRQNKRRAALYPWEKHHVKGNIRAGVCPFWVISQLPQRIEYVASSFNLRPSKKQWWVSISPPQFVWGRRGESGSKKGSQRLFFHVLGVFVLVSRRKYPLRQCSKLACGSEKQRAGSGRKLPKEARHVFPGPRCVCACFGADMPTT